MYLYRPKTDCDMPVEKMGEPCGSVLPAGLGLRRRAGRYKTLSLRITDR